MDTSEPGLIEHWVQRLLARATSDLADGPHIMVARDPEDGSIYFTGPFSSVVDAFVAVEDETRRQSSYPERARLELTVAPIALP